MTGRRKRTKTTHLHTPYRDKKTLGERKKKEKK
jgi:hypothetical protein